MKITGFVYRENVNKDTGLLKQNYFIYFKAPIFTDGYGEMSGMTIIPKGVIDGCNITSQDLKDCIDNGYDFLIDQFNNNGYNTILGVRIVKDS